MKKDSNIPINNFLLLGVLSLCVISWGIALDKQVKQAVSDKCMGQFRFAENLNMYILISRFFKELS